MLPVLLLIHISVAAQISSNLRYKTLPLQSDTLLLDSLSIVPGTLVLRTAEGAVVDSNDYLLKAFDSKIYLRNRPAGDSVKVLYRVYPFSLAGETYNKDYRAYRNNSGNFLINPYVYKPDEGPARLIDFGSLDYNGSFSRGVSFGSNQSVVLNSLFNLQLSGMLTRDLEITAAITDNNIPIQPEGNTQQIQEFDRIFIQLRKDQHKVIVGDFDLFNPERDYFMKFSKKYQGGSYSGSFDIKKAGVLRAAAAGGISRGKFARNFLSVSEGNQGPYKLTGASGETFIIILANTEEVFINGVKMERGADRDYVIDYNLGEITFMPRRIITKDLRVVVEFEYSERNYLRTTAFAATGFETKKGGIYFNLYSEQDSKGQNVQQSLNAEKKTFLTTVGDSIQSAFYRGWDSVGFDANRILYEWRDTIVGGVSYDTVFVYSTNSAQAKYAVTFSLVGQGLGNYIPANTTANGRVYQWIAPDSTTGQKQGSYEPVIFLVTPKYQQLYTLGGEYRINNTNTIVADVAMSNTDVNMYSRGDDKDNMGFATRVNYKGAITTQGDSTKRSQQILLDVHYEFLQNRFNTIERYRNIEFNRDWNIGNTTQRFNEHLAIANVGYAWNGLGNIGYRFRTFLQDTFYRGFENGINGSFTKGGLNVVFTGSYLRSLSAVNATHFIRPQVDMVYSIKKLKSWRVGTQLFNETNMITNRGDDTLHRNSYLWQNYKVFLGSPDSATNRYLFEVVMRYEHKAQGNGFDRPHFLGHTVNFTGNIQSLKNQTLNYTLTYRNAQERDSVVTSVPEHFYLGRIDYNFTLLRGFIRSTTLYEVGSGRQQKTQITYQVSPTNQGDYVWKDANKDGIKQLEEFVISPFREDTSYLRVFVVTPEFISVNTNQFNQVLNINPAAIWKNTKGIKKVISMFSLFASIQITKKTFAGAGRRFYEYFNPVPLRSENENIVSTAISSRNSLFFNRLEARYGAQIDVNYARNRTLLTTGFENRVLQSQGITLRGNPYKALSLQANYTHGLKANESDFYRNLRYRFTYNDAAAEVSYQFKTFLRITGKYDFSLKKNPTDTVGTQTAQVHRVTLQGRYNRQTKSTVDASLSFASIAYKDNGYANQQLEYAMLEGLQNGNNLVWTLGFEQTLTSNIQLSITYDGRMTGFRPGEKATLNPIHTGRAEIRAIF